MFAIIDAFDEFRATRVEKLSATPTCTGCSRYDKSNKNCVVSRPDPSTSEFDWMYAQLKRTLVEDNPKATVEQVENHMHKKSDHLHPIESWHPKYYKVKLTPRMNENNDCPVWDLNKEFTKFLNVLKDFVKQVEIV
jgi:hypothetical protein